MSGKGRKVHRASDKVQAHMRREAALALQAQGTVAPTPTRVAFKDLRAAREQEFRELQRQARSRDPLLDASSPEPIAPSIQVVEDDWTAVAFNDAQGDGIIHGVMTQRHPDTIGVYAQPEPKSLYSPVSQGRNGSYLKRKASSKKKGDHGPIAHHHPECEPNLPSHLYRVYGAGFRPRST